MGEQKIREPSAALETRAFTQAVLTDLSALEEMIADGKIESGVRRIGAEQEVFLVDRSTWRPVPIATRVLEALEADFFTTELGRFNLELNLDPLVFEGDCLSRMERQLQRRLHRMRDVVDSHGAEVILTGILPTLRKSDLGFENMTPRRRYKALNEAMDEFSGGRYEFRLKGIDEVIVEHDSVMLEACCTSFQFHFQVDPEEFAPLYNLAQVITGPVLAAAVNSPLLFGRRLWRETRIPLFQQAVDTRSASYHLRDLRPRVRFGKRWVRDSVVELFRQDIARFRVIVTSPRDEEDPFALLDSGRLPELHALQIHNGTVYRWNRPCYGLLDSRGHLRIETRALPAGPSVLDEIANAAFFYGLMSGLSAEIDDVTRHIELAQARANFYAAAEFGLACQLNWLDDELLPARRLIRERLLPAARRGLESSGIQAHDIDRYLEVIEERVASGRTGSRWLLDSLAALRDEGTRDEMFTALTAATAQRQWSGEPGHRWELAHLQEGIAMTPRELKVEEFMKTDLYTVDPEEPVTMVARLMEWHGVRQVAVEDADGKLVGLVSWLDVLRRAGQRDDDDPVAVKEIMEEAPVTVAAEASLADAIGLLREHGAHCLPVVRSERLVGIVTEEDFVHIVARFLDE